MFCRLCFVISMSCLIASIYRFIGRAGCHRRDRLKSPRAPRTPISSSPLLIPFGHHCYWKCSSLIESRCVLYFPIRFLCKISFQNFWRRNNRSVVEWVDCRASDSELVDSASIFDWVKPKTIKINIHSFLAWRSAIKRESVKLPPCVVDRWAGGSLTWRSQGHFIVFCLTQLGEYICNYITVPIFWIYPPALNLA